MPGTHSVVLPCRGPEARCPIGGAGSLRVLGKAAGREQPGHPEGSASLIALPSLCQEAPPKRGWQKNATDILLLTCGRTGALFVTSSLELESITPALAAVLAPSSMGWLPGG